MQTKIFELRDEGTCIPVLCIKLASKNEAERYLLARTGYGRVPENHEQYVLMLPLAGGRGQYNCDPYEWVGNRTKKQCHHHITEHWDELESGQVVDYEFIYK